MHQVELGICGTKDVVYAPGTGILATPIAAASSPEADPRTSWAQWAVNSLSSHLGSICKSDTGVAAIQVSESGFHAPVRLQRCLRMRNFLPGQCLNTA